MTSLPHNLSRACAASLTWLPAMFAAAQTPELQDEQSGKDHQKLAPVTVQHQRRGGDYSGQSRDAIGLDLADRDIPQSVSVVTATKLTDFGLHTANAALSHVTGVTVEQFETDRSNYTSRGFDITNFQFDGIGLPFTNGSQIGDLDTAVFEQIDVLRGANGLLSATGNPSATVNFIRKRPTAKARASAGLTLGSWRDRRIDLDGSGPLTPGGSVRGRAIAVRERSASYLDRYGIDKTLVTGLLDIDLGANTTLGLGHLVQRNNATRPMWGALTLVHSDGTPTDYPVSASTAPDWAYWDNTDRRTHAELTHRFESDWTLKAVSFYRQMNYGSELSYVYGDLDPTTRLGLVAYPSRTKSLTRQRMGDLRLSGPLRFWGRENQALLGVNWGAQHHQATYEGGLVVPVTSGDLGTWGSTQPLPQYQADLQGYSNARSDRRSLYAALHLKPSEALGLVLGANLNRVTSRGEDDGASDSYRSRVLTPYVGAVYTVSDAVSVYGSLTRIFNPQDAADENRRLLGPVQGRNLEAGIKSEWLSKRLLASVAVFKAQQENLAAPAGLLPDLNPYYKGESVGSSGFEAEVSGRPLPGWELGAGYAQLRMHDDQGQPTRTFVPRRTFNATTTYQLPSLPALRLGANLRWQSATSVPVETFTAVQKAYSLLDLMASYELSPRTHLSFNVNNVGNTKHLSSLYWNWAYYGPPRSVSVNLSAAF